MEEDFAKGILRNGRSFSGVFDRIFMKYDRVYDEDEIGGEVIDLNNLDEIEAAFKGKGGGEHWSGIERSVIDLAVTASDDESEPDTELTALLHEKVVQVKKEINWDEEEELYQRKLRERKLEHWQLDESSDSEPDTPSRSHKHTKSSSYLVPLKTSSSHSRSRDTDGSETIYETGLESEFENSRQTHTQDASEMQSMCHSGPEMVEPQTTVSQETMPDITELNPVVKLEHPDSPVQIVTQPPEPISGPDTDSETVETQESIFNLIDVPRGDSDLKSTVTRDEASTPVLKRGHHRTFELKIRKLPLVDASPQSMVVTTPSQLCHIASHPAYNGRPFSHSCSCYSCTVPIQHQPMAYHSCETSCMCSIPTPVIPPAATCNCCYPVISYCGCNCVHSQYHMSQPAYPMPQCMCHTCTQQANMSMSYSCFPTSHVQGESITSAPESMQDNGCYQLHRKRRMEDEDSMTCGPQKKRHCSSHIV